MASLTCTFEKIDHFGLPYKTRSFSKHSSQNMACCPPSALPYLAAQPVNNGSKKSIEGVEFYETGAASKAAIILFPDVWGWDSGRTRALADAFADQGYRTYVPKVLQPAHKGGTDGDGLPPAFDLATQGEEFMGWITTVKWEAIEKQVRALLAYAKAEGATSFGVVGCCWGGWPCFETSAMTTGLCPASVVRPSPSVAAMAWDRTPSLTRHTTHCISRADVKCGVIFHPSCQIVGAHGGDPVALAGKVQAPHYFMPAGGDDPALYGPEGSLVKACPAGSKQNSFTAMAHGWTSRGGASDLAVAEAIKLAMTEAIAYLKEHLPL